MKQVFFIENIIECRIFLREHFPTENCFLIVCDNAEAQAALLNKRVSFKAKSDYLTKEELNRIRQVSIQYMDDWYKHNDSLEYKGIHLGSLYSLDFSFIERIVLYIEKIIKVTEREQPHVLFVSESQRPLAENIIHVCRFENIRIETYRLNFFEALKSRIINNPYYRYLTRSFKLRILVNEIRDYVLPIPREFMMKGKEAGRIQNNSILVTVMNKNEVISSANTIRELQKRGHNTIIFTIDCDGGGVLKRLETEGFVEYVRPGDLFNKHYKGLYKEICGKIEKRWSEVSNDPGFRDSLLHKGVPVLRYVSPEKLAWMVTKLSPYWAVIYEMVSDLIRNVSATAVISMNDSINLGRVAATAAHEKSVPSIDIQHGAFASISAAATATKWCIWSNYDRNLLIEEGIPDHKLAVTGNPTYDSMMSKKYDACAIKREMGISETFKTIISWAPSVEWLFNYSEEDYNERTF